MCECVCVRAPVLVCVCVCVRVCVRKKRIFILNSSYIPKVLFTKLLQKQHSQEPRCIFYVQDVFDFRTQAVTFI
jgi:hypothetical protein